MGKLPTPITREEIYLNAIAQGGGGGSSSADDVSYDNTTSGLNADNVQDAIDEVAQSGGTTYDVTISGSIAETGDYPKQADYLAADYVANTTMAAILTKVEARGKIDIDGVLDKNHDTYQGVVVNWGCNCIYALTVASQTAAQILPTLGITDYDGETDGVLAKVGSFQGGDGAVISLIIYNSTSGVKCVPTNAI